MRSGLTKTPAVAARLPSPAEILSHFPKEREVNHIRGRAFLFYFAGQSRELHIQLDAFEIDLCVRAVGFAGQIVARRSYIAVEPVPAFEDVDRPGAILVNIAKSSETCAQYSLDQLRIFPEL